MREYLKYYLKALQFCLRLLLLIAFVSVSQFPWNMFWAFIRHHSENASIVSTIQMIVLAGILPPLLLFLWQFSGELVHGFRDNDSEPDGADNPGKRPETARDL